MLAYLISSSEIIFSSTAGSWIVYAQIQYNKYITNGRLLFVNRVKGLAVPQADPTELSTTPRALPPAPASTLAWRNRDQSIGVGRHKSSAPRTNPRSNTPRRTRERGNRPPLLPLPPSLSPLCPLPPSTPMRTYKSRERYSCPRCRTSADIQEPCSWDRTTHRRRRRSRELRNFRRVRTAARRGRPGTRETPCNPEYMRILPAQRTPELLCACVLKDGGLGKTTLQGDVLGASEKSCVRCQHTMIVERLVCLSQLTQIWVKVQLLHGVLHARWQTAILGKIKISTPKPRE